MPKVEVQCAICGKTIWRWPFQIRNSKTGSFYCSSLCEGEGKRTGHINNKGYVFSQFQGRRVMEHRLVMERILGRELLPSEVVHHINGNKLDNRPENLEVTSQTEHMCEHKPLSFCIETAEAMLRNGNTASETALELGIERHTLDEALRRRGKTINSLRGLARGARIAWDYAKIKEMALQGVTSQEIAKSFGGSLPCLKRFLKIHHGTTVSTIRDEAAMQRASS